MTTPRETEISYWPDRPIADPWKEPEKDPAALIAELDACKVEIARLRGHVEEWQEIAAKLAFVAMQAKHPELSEADQEEAAAQLLVRIRLS